MNQKIKEFVNDKVMAEAVYGVLWRFFLKKRPTSDTQMLAAERLAALLLQDAWKELEQYKIEEKKEKKPGNVGL